MSSEFKSISIFKSFLHSEIEIPFSVDEIWEQLADLSSYTEWNPILQPLSGSFIAGEKIKIQLSWPDLKSDQYTLLILESKKYTISWLGHFAFPKLMDGHHSFILESIDSNNTRLIQKESFSGFLVPIMNPWLKNNIQQGFNEMNQAFKAHCIKHFSSNT